MSDITENSAGKQSARGGGIRFVNSLRSFKEPTIDVTGLISDTDKVLLSTVHRHVTSIYLKIFL